MKEQLVFPWQEDTLSDGLKEGLHCGPLKPPFNRPPQVAAPVLQRATEDLGQNEFVDLCYECPLLEGFTRSLFGA